MKFISIWMLVAALNCQAQDSSEHRHFLLPDHVPLQYAGNIGFLSTGIGYSIFKDKIELDFMYGYVPVEFGGPLNSITFKSTWIPWKPVILGDYAIDIFTIGGYLNYTLGDKYFFIASTMDRYPSRYYDYSSALRVGGFVGGRVHLNLNASTIKRIAFYYEAGTYDLALHNYIFNISKSGFTGLFSLAFGLKFYFEKNHRMK